jgi:hypothetical protein
MGRFDYIILFIIYSDSDGECVEVDCDSVHYNHKDCNVIGMIKDSYIYSMDVVERRSPARCKRNDSFGYKKRDNIWVNQGCMANFEVCFIRGNIVLY